MEWLFQYLLNIAYEVCYTWGFIYFYCSDNIPVGSRFVIRVYYKFFCVLSLCFPIEFYNILYNNSLTQGFWYFYLKCIILFYACMVFFNSGCYPGFTFSIVGILFKRKSVVKYS